RHPGIRTRLPYRLPTDFAKAKLNSPDTRRTVGATIAYVACRVSRGWTREDPRMERPSARPCASPCRLPPAVTGGQGIRAGQRTAPVLTQAALIACVAQSTTRGCFHAQ